MDKEYKHDNHAIMREVGIPYNFLKRCNSEIPTLERFRQKKDKNKIYYSDDGLIVWREIRSLFEQGKTMGQINSYLETTFGSKETTHEYGSETRGISLENKESERNGGGEDVQYDHIKIFLDAIERQAGSAAQAWQKAYERSEKDAEQAHRKVADLEAKMLALPEGKTPEQVASDLNAKDEQEKTLRRLQGLEAKRRELWLQYGSQTGWGARKRKTDILKKIKNLNEE